MAPKPPLTHFLCIPLATEASRPQLARSQQHLRSRLRDASAGQLDPDTLGRAIRPPSAIHLTLGVMSLETPERVAGAAALLRELDLAAILRSAVSGASAAVNDGPASLPPPPLTVALASLASLKRGPKTSVLHAEPLDGTGRLAAFCEAVRKRFMDAGFVLDEGRALALHATVLNTIYARGGGRRARPQLFDAGGLMREFAEFVWAEEVRVERVAVCRMGAQQVADARGEVVDERYEEIAVGVMPGG